MLTAIIDTVTTTSSLVPPDALDLGGMGIAGYALWQLVKLVTGVTTFLAKLEQKWEAEEKHRRAELEHHEDEQRLLEELVREVQGGQVVARA